MMIFTASCGDTNIPGAFVQFYPTSTFTFILRPLYVAQNPGLGSGMLQYLVIMITRVADWMSQDDDLGPIQGYSWDSAYSCEPDEAVYFALYMRSMSFLQLLEYSFSECRGC